jgi:hypothetical protein
MATANPTTRTDCFRAFNDLWMRFFAISGCAAGAANVAAGALSDHSSYEEREQLHGLIVAIRALAAEGERLAAEAREGVPLEG